MTMKKILILGGGYAGVTAAVHLHGVAADITLVNTHGYHHLTTLLHQPAVGRRHYEDLSVTLQQVLPRPVRFLRGRVQALDPTKRTALVKARGGVKTLDYDILVLALGWRPQYFDIPGLQEASLTLEDLNKSRTAKDRIEESLIAFDEDDSQRWRTCFVVGGGGLTGIELTGELVDSLPALGRAFDLTFRDFTIFLVEGAPNLLPGMDPWLAQRATAYLKRRGVRVLTGVRITGVAGEKISLSDGTTIQAGALFWTGGVRASEVPEKAGLPVGKAGRVVVDQFLQVRGHPEIFAAGDCAMVTDARGVPMPPTAWIAVQHGQSIAENIHRHFAGKDMQPCSATSPAVILSMGRREALGIVYGKRISGATAGLLKDMLAFRYLYGIGGLALVMRKLWEWTPYLIHLHRL
ncbi:NAD(P)/FAD-dependent oxidoreductase [uncultured Desulfosarcina sp.]|uniref:NAD(P)/FAD-dependent oxidoreductase n=1 Tax=uncultured Desulfosarcina sp. TaxID=218289 RepID=UPI0029C89DF4|nr:NAD(P)/FAD-dependent oxidoreductase [uncultured Desulfosarcina sp.]